MGFNSKDIFKIFFLSSKFTQLSGFFFQRLIDVFWGFLTSSFLSLFSLLSATKFNNDIKTHFDFPLSELSLLSFLK